MRLEKSAQLLALVNARQGDYVSVRLTPELKRSPLGLILKTSTTVAELMARCPVLESPDN